jgi:hypothetical protein
VPAFFDNLDRFKRRGGREKKNWSARGNERRQAGGQHQCEGVERPDRVVIVVGTYHFESVLLRNGPGRRMKMCVQDPGMIVVRSRACPRVNMLKRRHKESQYDRETGL